MVLEINLLRRIFEYERGGRGSSGRPEKSAQ
jgi:hypothetical protein